MSGAKRMTREQALAVIRVDVAVNGKLTRVGLRVFCENRVSYAAMQEVTAQGLAQHRAAARAAEKKEGPCTGET